MFTRRELIIAVGSIALTLTAVVGAKQVEPKIMGSSIFEWNNFEANRRKLDLFVRFFNLQPRRWTSWNATSRR